MNCHEARLHWELYYDSEGDPGIHLHLNEHLAGCESCARWFHNQSRLESLIEKHVDAELPGKGGPDVDWDKVVANLDDSNTKASRNWSWIGGPLAAIAATLLVMMLLSGDFWKSDQAASLPKLTAELHQHVSTGSLRPEFESGSDLEVESYFLNRVSFPVRCPPRKDSGFAVRGAGLCELADQSAAYVVGSVDQQPVSIFVLPIRSLEAFPKQREELQREAMRVCREGRNEMVYSVIDKNVVLVIGNVTLEKLTRVLKSYGSYPHAS